MRNKNCSQPIKMTLGDICDEFIRNPESAYFLRFVGDRVFFRDNLLYLKREKTQTNLFANIINKTKSQIKVERKGYSKQLSKISNSTMKSKSPLSHMKADRNQSHVVKTEYFSQAENYQPGKKENRPKIDKQKFQEPVQKEEYFDQGYIEYEKKIEPQTVSWNIKNKIVRSKVKQNSGGQIAQKCTQKDLKQFNGVEPLIENTQKENIKQKVGKNSNMIDFSFMQSFGEKNIAAMKNEKLPEKISEIIEESLLVQRIQVVKSGGDAVVRQINSNILQPQQKVEQISCRISVLKQPDQSYIKSIIKQKIPFGQINNSKKQEQIGQKEENQIIVNPYAKVDQERIQNSNGLLSELQKRKSNLTDEQFCKIYSSFKKAEKLSQAFDISDIDIDKLLKIKKSSIKQADNNLRSLKIMELVSNEELKQKRIQQIHHEEKQINMQDERSQKMKRKRPNLKLSLGTSFIPHYQLYPSPRSPESHRQLLAQFKANK